MSHSNLLTENLSESLSQFDGVWCQILFLYLCVILLDIHNQTSKKNDFFHQRMIISTVTVREEISSVFLQFIIVTVLMAAGAIFCSSISSSLFTECLYCEKRCW